MERSSRWPALVPRAIVAALAMAGCGSTGSSDSGRLSGSVASQGGTNGTITSAEAEVTATPTDSDTSKPYTTETTGDGSFNLDLPAGTYEITATLTTKTPGGQVNPQQVTIARGQTTKVELVGTHP